METILLHENYISKALEIISKFFGLVSDFIVHLTGQFRALIPINKIHFKDNLNHMILVVPYSFFIKQILRHTYRRKPMFQIPLIHKPNCITNHHTLTI